MEMSAGGAGGCIGWVFCVWVRATVWSLWVVGTRPSPLLSIKHSPAQSSVVQRSPGIFFMNGRANADGKLRGEEGHRSGFVWAGFRLPIDLNVAQAGDLLCRRLAVGGRCVHEVAGVSPMVSLLNGRRISNPRHGRLPARATPLRHPSHEREGDFTKGNKGNEGVGKQNFVIGGGFAGLPGVEFRVRLPLSPDLSPLSRGARGFIKLVQEHSRIRKCVTMKPI